MPDFDTYTVECKACDLTLERDASEPRARYVQDFHRSITDRHEVTVTENQRVRELTRERTR